MPDPNSKLKMVGACTSSEVAWALSKLKVVHAWAMSGLLRGAGQGPSQVRDEIRVMVTVSVRVRIPCAYTCLRTHMHMNMHMHACI